MNNPDHRQPWPRMPRIPIIVVMYTVALVACAMASDAVRPCDLLPDFFNGAPVSEVFVPPYTGGNERLLSTLLDANTPAQSDQALTAASVANLHGAIGTAASCGAAPGAPARAPFRVDVVFEARGNDSTSVLMICKICKTAVLAVRHGATTRVSREFPTDGAEHVLDGISARYRESVPKSGG